jgi:hypothetical protein
MACGFLHGPLFVSEAVSIDPDGRAPFLRLSPLGSRALDPTQHRIGVEEAGVLEACQAQAELAQQKCDQAGGSGKSQGEEPVAPPSACGVTVVDAGLCSQH